MHCEGKKNLRSHNTRCCLIEVVTKAGLTVSTFLLVHHIHKNMCTSKKITCHFQIAFVTITFLMWENPTYQFSLKLEHFEILCILVAILKMAAKMTVILKLHWSRSHSSKKNLNINFLCNWSISKLFMCFGNHIENSCQNGHHNGCYGHF